MSRWELNRAVRRGDNRLVAKAQNRGSTSTTITLRRSRSMVVRKLMSAPFSTRGKRVGMMIMVTMLAMMVKVVRDPMLPPSFSAMTTTAAAVGQMKQMNMPSSMSLVSGEWVPRSCMRATMMRLRVMRVAWMAKCHVRGLSSWRLILQNVK